MQVILTRLNPEQVRVELPEACPTCGTSPTDEDEGVRLDGYDSVTYDGTLILLDGAYVPDLDTTDAGDCDEVAAYIDRVRCGKCGMILVDANKEV